MAENTLNVGWEVFWVAFGIAIALAWLIGAVLHYRFKHVTPSMPMTPTPTARQAELTHMPGTEPAHKPGGYVMAFNKHIEEAEGGLSPLGWLVLVGIPTWWLVYLIVYWDRALTALPTKLLPY